MFPTEKFFALYSENLDAIINNYDLTTDPECTILGPCMGSIYSLFGPQHTHVENILLALDLASMQISVFSVGMGKKVKLSFTHTVFVGIYFIDI